MGGSTALATATQLTPQGSLSTMDPMGPNSARVSRRSFTQRRVEALSRGVRDCELCIPSTGSPSTVHPASLGHTSDPSTKGTTAAASVKIPTLLKRKGKLLLTICVVQTGERLNRELRVY